MAAKTLHFEPKFIGELLDVIHNAIIVINSENRIIFANSRTVKMFQTSFDELRDSDFFNLFLPDDIEIMVPNILAIILKDQEFEGEAMLKRPDGTTFMGMLSGTYFHWDNIHEGMAFTIHDLTDMKKLEYSLRHSERIAFLGRLVDDISHQIRNPVMVIGGLARRLNAEEASSPKVNAIIKEANRLEQLLDTLHEFINLRCPDPKRLPMSELIHMAESTLRSEVEALGCKWKSDYETDISDENILIDKDLLMEAMRAVLVNACQSYDKSDEGKNVTFQIYHSGDPAFPFKINIVDHGIGITTEILPHILGPFYSTKTRHMGMGLTMAQRIVEEQRGNLTVTSEVGEGSTVSFHLVKDRRRPIRIARL